MQSKPVAYMRRHKGTGILERTGLGRAEDQDWTASFPVYETSPSPISADAVVARHRAIIDRIEPIFSEDWTVSDTETAGAILAYLGIGQDASKEPYADPRRDFIARVIRARIDEDDHPYPADADAVKPVAAYTVDLTGCEHISRDVAGIERIAAAGANGETKVVYLYDAPSPTADADAVVEACAEIKAVKEYAEHVALGLACGMNVTAATKALIGFCRALKDTLPIVEGWQLVPVEPTQEMIDEACRTAPHVILTYTKPEERDGSVPLIPIATWRAMIAAAPSTQEADHENG